VLARRLTDAGLAHPVPPQWTTEPDVTVVVPARDRADLLARCLAGVGDRYPVVVVDDGSRDPGAVAAVADRHGAKLLRRATNGGPGPARDTALEHVDSEFIAFLDSDCAPDADWIGALATHFADPLVAAVAPRIVGATGPTWAGRYTTANGALDLGVRPASVAPGRPVSYVPTAALLVRRAALRDIARDGLVFDPALRVGEDVDLIWRLHQAGWRIRYDPRVRVQHHEPATWPGVLSRRFRYGTSAAPLARRHPTAVSPLVVRPWPALTAGTLLAGRPGPAAMALGSSVFAAVRALRRAGLPPRVALRVTSTALARTWLGVGRYGTQFVVPLLVLLAASGSQTPTRRWIRRGGAASLLLGPPLTAWASRRPALDPARFVLGHLADDIAYGLGVWTGCVRERTTVPLRPTIT
jgi:mycofactocin system glycosyltransferase